MRLLNQSAERAEHAALHAQLGEAEHRRLLIENSHDAAFAPNRRDSRDTKVDLAPGGANSHTSVLRQSAFGDIQVCKYLDTAHNGGMEAFRR